MAATPLILIVDDNIDAREMYGCILQHEGFRWAEAVNGQDASPRKERKPVAHPDGRDHAAHGRLGSDALLKADEPRGTFRSIMLTAHAFDEHRERAKEAGADWFLAKPVLPDELAAEIRRVLGL